MKTWDEIRVEDELSEKDFITLFEKLPLNEEEHKSLNEYFLVYKTFITSEVSPINAWVATRNIFAIKNLQIAERIKNKI